MELAPIVGLADCIVDVVDTGSTLEANGLEPMEHMFDVSSRMIVNEASMKMRNATIRSLLKHIESALQKPCN